MAREGSNGQLAVIPEGRWLTLKQAAELCGMNVGALERLIQAGDLRAFTVERKGKVRFRVLRSSLIDAGLLTKNPPLTSSQSGTVDLLALIRDQNQRIARLDDQRAQIAGQLGVALERLRSIDERLTYLESDPMAHFMDAREAEPQTEASDPASAQHKPMAIAIRDRTGEVLKKSIKRVAQESGKRRPWKHDSRTT